MAELRIVLANVNGLRARKTELEQYLSECKPHIVLLNETKLCGKSFPRFAGYQVAAARDRTAEKTQGGGTAILVSKSVTFSDISPDMDDLVAIETVVGSSKYAVICYYCPPDGRDLNSGMLEQFVLQHERVIIAGDLNAKHQYFGSKSTDARGEQLFDLVERHSLIVANDPDQMTRHDVSTGNSDLIDYLIVSKSVAARAVECYVGECIGSDHLPVHLSIQLSCQIKTVRSKQVRILAKCDWAVFSDKLSESSSGCSSVALNSEAAIDERCDEIRQSITQAIDLACPKRTIKDYAFRLRPETVNLIRLKRKLRRKSQKSNDPRYRTLYNIMSRRVNAAVWTERQNAWHAVTASLDETDGRSFWLKFKMLTGEAKSSRKQIRLKDENDEATSDSVKVASMFAESLKKIHVTHNGPEFCATMKSEVERQVQMCIGEYTPNYMPKAEAGDSDPLADTIDVAEMAGARKLCKSNTAPGQDEITYGILKKVPDCTLSLLADLYTACLTFGYFPKAWKSAIGVMLPKPNKDEKIVTNYRPISLLSTMGKLFEKIIARRMHSHFREIGFFNQYQRAYLEKKEATEHVYCLTEEIRMAREKGWTTTAISLDVEKAFDSVWHDGLRHKLSQLQLPVKLVRLVSSFLANRTIQVRVDQTLSHSVSLEAGTPQGSVLSPLLFLIYVNDLPVRPENNCRAGQFADDISMWTTYKTKRVSFLRLQRAMKDIEKWCSRWRIKLNVAKTQLVSFSNVKPRNMKLELFGEPIPEQNEMSLLGVTFSKTMRLAKHCKSKASKAMQRVRLLRMVSGKRWGAKAHTLLKLYKQYIRPVLESGYVTTSKACPASLMILQRIQNAALRTALRAESWSKITALHELAKMEPLTDRLRRLRCKAEARYGQSELIKSLNTQKSLLSGMADKR